MSPKRHTSADPPPAEALVERVRAARPAGHDPEESGEWMRPERPRQPQERLLWLAFDRATAVTDARWVRQATDLDVLIVRSVDDVANACTGALPLGCVVEYELGGAENGVKAIERLRELGVELPAVLITAVPELALGSLQRSRLSEVIPVFLRTERYDRLREWFDELRMCLAVPA